LRAWTDAGEVRGLDRLTANLVIAAWAVVTDRVWCRGDVQVPEPALEQITDDMELREQDLPDAAVWDRAVDRVAALLDLEVNRYRTAANVATLAQRAREVARQRRGSATELVRLLEAHAAPLGISPAATTGRLATARAASRLLDDVEQVAGDTTLVNLVSAAELPADDHTIGRSLRNAAQLVDALSRTRWELLDALHALPGEDAQGILARLADAGALDEFQAPLDAALRQAETAAVRLLAARQRGPGVPEEPESKGAELPGGRVDGAQGTLVLEADALAQGEAAEELDRRLRAFAAVHRGEHVRVSWRAEP
jgi:hypothetical protein